MRGGLWVAGVQCYSAVRLHSEHVRGQGTGSYPMLSQELQAVLSRMGKLDRFRSQEPGRAWLRPLLPNREVGFRSQHITFGSSPHPSPRSYKGRSTEPLALCFALYFSAPLSSALGAPRCLYPSLFLHSWLVCDWLAIECSLWLLVASLVGTWLLPLMQCPLTSTLVLILPTSEG